MHKKVLFVCIVFIAALFLAVSLNAGKIQKSEVPSAVLAAFEKAFPTAVVKAYSSEMNKGKINFEIESVDGKNTRDCLYTADGKLIEMEESLQPSDLPEAISKAVSQKYPQGKIKKAERLTRGEFVGYEIAVVVGNKTVEMTLDARGKTPIAEEEEAEEGKSEGQRAKIKLPDVVAKVIKENCPGAEIAMAEVEKEAGITLYDIEFKANKGEIEIAEDGTVLDVATVVEMKDVPQAAAEAIQKAASGARIKQIEKSEVRAEIKKQGEKGNLVKLNPPHFVYEAEMIKGNQYAEIQVDPDGKVIEAPKWRIKGTKEKD